MKKLTVIFPKWAKGKFYTGDQMRVFWGDTEILPVTHIQFSAGPGEFTEVRLDLLCPEIEVLYSDELL